MRPLHPLIYLGRGARMCSGPTYSAVIASIVRYWWQPFGPGDGKLYTRGVTTVDTAGNVGTTSYTIMAAFRSSPIGLLCLEFAWSDETPLWPVDFYNKVQTAVRHRLPLARFRSVSG